ncbi:MAG: hypothetical protein WKG07_41960 [Hymenobacter sp.]
MGLSAGLLAAAPAAQAQTKHAQVQQRIPEPGRGSPLAGHGQGAGEPGQRCHRRLLEPRRPHQHQAHKYDGVLMHSELFSGVVKNDYAAFAMPLDEKSAIGVTLLRSGVDNIADTRYAHQRVRLHSVR